MNADPSRMEGQPSGLSTGMRVVAMLVAFAAARTAAVAAGQMAGVESSGGTISAVPAALLAFGLVYGGFELLAKAWTRRTVLVVLWVVAPLMLLAAVGINAALENTIRQERPAAKQPVALVQSLAPPVEPTRQTPIRQETPSLEPAATQDAASAWDSEVDAFVDRHPEVLYGANKALVQEAINNAYKVSSGRLTDRRLLEFALSYARKQPGWSSTTIDAAGWDQAVREFSATHPEIIGAPNEDLMQKYINKLSTTKMGNETLLRMAYAAAREDPEWQR